VTVSPPSLGERLLINRDFAWLWVAQAASSFGEYLLASTVTVWLVLDLAAGQPGLPALVSAVVLTSTLPRLIVAPLVGVFVDRWRADRVMVQSDLIRFALFPPMLVVVAVAGDVFIIGALLVLLTMIGAVSQFFMPARAAALQVLLPEDRRADAAGKMMFAAVGIAVIATTAGPALYALVGPIPALIVNALTFLLSAACIRKVKGAHAAHPDGDTARRYWPEFAAGCLIAFRTPPIRTVMLGVAFYGFSLGVNNLALPLFALETLSLTSTEYGVVTGAFSLGGLVGSLCAPWVAKIVKPHAVFVLGLGSMGLIYIVYSQVHDFVPAVVLMTAAGIAFSLYLVSQGPILQAATPVGFMGRVTAITTPTLALTSLLGTAATGWLLSVGTEETSAVYASAILIGAFLLCLGAVVMVVAGWMTHRDGAPTQR
jgi:MFS family permease